MINNFPQIRNLLSFPTSESFYFLEIIKRRKENPEMERHQKLIKDFYIYSFKEFDELEGKVIELCEENNARAYFRLNGREGKQVALQYLKRIAELLLTEDYKAIPRSYASVVGEFCRKEGKTWLIDIDNPESGVYTAGDIAGRVANRIRDIYSEYNKDGEDPIVAEINTKNGIHLITKPFRKDLFTSGYPDIDIHNDNPTILYVP